MFCLYENKIELDFFLTSTLSQSEIQRYVLVLSNSEARYNELRSSLEKGFFIKYIKIPQKISAKWKKNHFIKLLDEIFDSIPKVNEKKNFFIDLSTLIVTKGFFDCIEAEIENKLRNYEG